MKKNMNEEEEIHSWFEVSCTSPRCKNDCVIDIIKTNRHDKDNKRTCTNNSQQQQVLKLTMNV